MKFEDHLKEIQALIKTLSISAEQQNIIDNSEGLAKHLTQLSEKELVQLLRAHNSYED